MPSQSLSIKAIFLCVLWVGSSSPLMVADQAKTAGSIRGVVTLHDSAQAVPAASVTIIQLGRSVMTNDQGEFEFAGIPPGSYDLASHMHALASPIQRIRLAAGQLAVANFQLSISPIRNEITVTATGRQETAFAALPAVATIDALRLSEQSAFSLGDVVGNESGVHKRSFGPGSARPVVRGFDGDRVLILNDGLPTGTLSSQSGEHAEPIDAADLDRVEVLKGPATLLYGSNAIGGVVNLVTAHHLQHEQPHPGFRGQVTAIGGTNSHQAAGHANVEYGVGSWLFWSSTSRQVASDYASPQGPVENSKTRMTSGSAGLGWFSDGAFMNLSYAFNKGRLGVPFAGEFHHHHEDGEEPASEEHEEEAQVDETFTWQNIRLNAGARHFHAAFDELKIAVNFSRWIHKELENAMAATAFDNKLWNVRATLTQYPGTYLSGTSGVQLFHRDYHAEGEEALAPPTTSHGLAAFTLQELDLRAARLQIGGRLDHTTYDPAGMPQRSFTGFSGAAGIHLPLWEHGAAVANYTHSYRAPALDELYNNGPHIGNLAFEVGDPDLKREVADGMDLSLRHASERLDAAANFYYYRLRDFVYLDLTGESAHGLRVARFAQADARFLGGELQWNAALHPNIWLLSAMDLVNAERIATGTPLPRIPPLRGKIGVDARWRGVSVRPEIVLASAQDRLSPTETRTPGYAVINLAGSYTRVQPHLMHVFSINLFNAGDRFYRNHLSFIKDLAPEMGRGIRFTYSLRFF